MKAFNPRTTTRALVIAGWAAFFIYLWASGEQVRFIGPRTQWVVPFGALTLTLAAIAHLFILRSKRPVPLRRSELLGAFVTMLPIAALLMAPAPELGALAASRKSGTTGLASAAAFAPPAGDRPVSFIDVHYAELSEDYAASAGIVDGRPLELVGFVSGSDEPGTFQLTRFYISCCAADAIPYSVTILPADGESFDDDTWLRVDGELVAREGGYALQAESIDTVHAPKNPYLS